MYLGCTLTIPIHTYNIPTHSYSLTHTHTHTYDVPHDGTEDSASARVEALEDVIKSQRPSIFNLESHCREYFFVFKIMRAGANCVLQSFQSS